MTTPTNKEINDVLDKLESPKWQSDAERDNLQVVNIHDSGAPVLDRDRVLRESYPDHAGRNGR
jgi:hypothetical protein